MRTDRTRAGVRRDDGNASETPTRDVPAPRVVGTASAVGSAVTGRRTLLTVAALTPVAVHELPHDTDQLGGLERLGQEGVDTDGDAAAGLVLGAGADDRDRYMTGPRIGPQPLGGPQTVQTGHDDVQGDDIRTNLVNDIQTLGTIGRGHHLEALKLEVDPDQLPDHPVVIDNEHPTGHA